MTPARQLRQRLAQPEIIRSLGAHDAFSARVMQEAGLEMIFLGGFGAAASALGMPDLGLITLTEMSEIVRRIAAVVRIPIVADGDTGHGDLHNVARTVREFERAGAAGILIEDQVSPKRCGHFAGKQVIGPEEMEAKVRMACAVRQDPDFVIIARTDARAVEGAEAAISRANRYGDAGADLAFIEAPLSLAELEHNAQAVRYPMLVNALTGGRTPIVSAQQFQQWGYRIVVCPVASLLITVPVLRQLCQALLEEGRTDQLAQPMISFDELKQLLGVDEIIGESEAAQ
jgi:2-methylisocitrate lyase-like PEP mutase family enzyme